MKKKLVTIGNFSEFICGKKFIASKDMIITSGARDKIREAGVEVVYEDQGLELKIKEILVKDFNITDNSMVERVIEKIKSMS
ncbi:MAG: hypothetical protein KBF12_05400 [Sebaldella sp.]|nr:hypothetical protein [Sebaldella sp.]